MIDGPRETLRAQLQASLDRLPEVRLTNCDGRYRVYPESGMSVLVAYSLDEDREPVRTIYGTEINGINHRVLYTYPDEAQRKADYLNARMQ